MCVPPNRHGVPRELRGHPVLPALAEGGAVYPHARVLRRTIALWAGITVAWAALLVVTFLALPEHFGAVLVASTVMALLVGAVMTVRLYKSAYEPLITVEDLRRRR